MDDYIIKDSSIWMGSDDSSVMPDATIKLGQVRDIVPIDEGADISYVCDVWLGGKYVPIQCFRTSRFGGLYNYEEFTYRGYELDADPSADSIMDYKQGDTVIIAYLMGDSREGIILGSINHPGRPKKFKEEDGVVYESEFNGINKSINIDGEYKVTFKGQPTNIDELTKISTGKPIPAAEYDEEVGFSYYEFDKTGSYMLTDSSTDMPQHIKIDKPGGKIEIVSGNTSFIIDKNEESYTITNKKVTFETEEEWNLTTKKTTIESEELIDAKAADIKTEGEWSQKGNVKVEGNIQQLGNTTITGNLSTTGPTLLAGGANPLIYDIILTIGAGNLGAPVISSNIVLKTVQTKAT